MAMMQVPEVLDPSELDQPHSERIRQRPVDLDKKLPFVILADKDAEADDLENAQARRHFYRKATAEERAAIPIPLYTIVSTDDDPKEHFRRTPGYMHWLEKSLEDLMERVEYEADDADTAFIETLRLEHGLTPADLDEDKFELILDRLEKKAFQRSNKKILEKSDANAQQSGDDVPCAVCNDRDYEPKNLIVFCDGCNVAVHQDCYGLKKIPDGQWYCNRCKAGEQTAQCDLCPTETGAFKPTDTGGWCHVSCAIWMPGVHIDDVNKMEPVSGVKSVNPERFNLVCSVCGQKHGACIQCKYGSCVAAFHVTCAQTSGLYMNIQEGQKDVLYTAYCKKHSDLKYEQDMCEKVRNGTFIAEELGAAKLAKISQKANIKFSEAVMEDIFKYWVKKRNANGGRPLLGRLQQFADEKAASNLPISSSLKAHLSSNQSFMQLVALRRELERLRTICDLAKKREHLKKERLAVIQRAFLVHVASVDPHLAASHPPLPPLVLPPASPAVPPPMRPHSTPSRNDAARVGAEVNVPDSPSEPALEDLNLMKQVVEAAITFVGRQSQELPKHDVLVSVLTKKAYKRGVTGLRALGKLYYVAGGNGGGSKYMLTNELTLSQVLSHLQRLIHRTSPSKRGRRSSLSVDDEEGSPKPQKTARKDEPEEEEAAAVSGEEENEEEGEPEEAQSGEAEAEAEEEEEDAEEEEEEEPVSRKRVRRNAATGAAHASPARPSRSRAAPPAAAAAAMTSLAAAAGGGGGAPKKLRQTKLQVVKKDARSPKKSVVVV